MLTKQARALPCCAYAACYHDLYLELSALAAANAESDREEVKEEEEEEAFVPMHKLSF